MIAFHYKVQVEHQQHAWVGLSSSEIVNRISIIGNFIDGVKIVKYSLAPVLERIFNHSVSSPPILWLD